MLVVGSQSTCDSWDCIRGAAAAVLSPTEVQDIELAGTRWVGAVLVDQPCMTTAPDPNRQLEGQLLHSGPERQQQHGAGVLALQQPSVVALPPSSWLSILFEFL